MCLSLLSVHEMERNSTVLQVAQAPVLVDLKQESFEVWVSMLYLSLTFCSPVLAHFGTCGSVG